MFGIDDVLGGIIGLGVGALKNQFVDKPREERDRRLAAETIRNSPWTGMRPEKIRESDLLGNMLQGGVTGLGVQSALKGLSKAVPLTAGTNPWRLGGEYTFQKPTVASLGLQDILGY